MCHRYVMTGARTTRHPVAVRDFPVRVPLIHGETTLSYLTRTAAANGLPLGALVVALGGRGHRAEVDPQREEVWLTGQALGRLGEFVGRDPAQLARALPSLRRPTGRSAAVRVQAWPQEFGGRPLPACPLCMEPGAWLAPDGHRWRPCPCGRRWMVGDDGGYLVPTGPVPDLARALRAHRALMHRLGPVGDALVADAHQVALWWWVGGQVFAPRWRDREDALGMARHRRRAAPVVVYPEAVALAGQMAAWEERRTAAGALGARWLDEVAATVPAGELSRREREPLGHWLEEHAADPGRRARRAGRRTAEQRWNRLPALHQRPGEPGPLRAVSCLRWVYGLPLTSVTAVCPRCHGRARSCRWVPYPGCTGVPAQ